MQQAEVQGNPRGSGHLKTKLSAKQAEVMNLLDSGMTAKVVAFKLGVKVHVVYRRKEIATLKRRVERKEIEPIYRRRVNGKLTNCPASARVREDEETAEEAHERLALDLALDVRCTGCYVVLEGSDCAEAGHCVARSPDLLRGDSMLRIARLWASVEVGKDIRGE